MKKIIIEFTDEEYKAMEASVIEGPEAWVNHMAHNRARKAMDNIIERETTHRAKALSKAEKEAIIKPMQLETAKARNAREKTEIEAKLKDNVSKKG